MNPIEFERIANKYLFASKSDIDKALVDPKTTGLELIVCAIVDKAIAEGDERRLETLLNRVIGKVKDEVYHSGLPQAAATVVILPAKDRLPDD